MQYLPYSEEKSWDEIMLSPTQLIWMERIEWLPTYSMAYNMMRWNTKNSRDLPAAVRYFYGVPGALWWMLVDWVWQIWNTALNWYKRVYNNAAALYNNAVAQLNSIWNTPQTRLTWRKITSDIAPFLPQPPEVVVTEVEQPVKYLYSDGKIQAEVVEPKTYNYSIPMDKITYRRKVANELKRMNTNWELIKNISRTKKLIDLYEKLK